MLQQKGEQRIPETYQIDLGSLKLKEILKFQRRGGCCKVLCVHCRSTHECDQNLQIAIVDLTAGANYAESV